MLMEEIFADQQDPFGIACRFWVWLLHLKSNLIFIYTCFIFYSLPKFDWVCLLINFVNKFLFFNILINYINE